MPARRRSAPRTSAPGGTAEQFALFAVAAPGLEPLLHDELRALGIDGRMAAGGVAFSGGVERLYAANLHLRTASRVLVRLGRFHAAAFHELERRAGLIPWEIAVRPGDLVEVRATSRKSRLYHSDAVAERVLAAVDTRVGGIRPASAVGAVSRPEPAPRVDDRQLVVVRIDRDHVTVSVDSSGANLHMRGYRQAVARAPLRETLAAALIATAGWDPRAPLVDPLCGSGTIPIEAALIARRIAPGIARRFAFERWPGFEPAIWGSLLGAAREAALGSAPAQILASDRDAGAIEATAANATRAGVLSDLSIHRRPLSAVEPPRTSAEAGWIVTNPPYGVRVGERAPLRDLYARLGQLARSRFAGWTLALLSADRQLDRQVALDLEERVRTSNGGIPVRMVAGRIPG